MCGLDTWFSVWTNFGTWIWAVFLIIQAGMVVFLVVHSRTEKTFRPVFFVFFVAVTVVDVVLVYRTMGKEIDVFQGSAGKDPSTKETAYSKSCRPADWSAFLRFETWIWAIFVLIQATMIVFLVVRGRRDKSFRQAFYVFFVAVTFVDCVLVLWRSPTLDYQFFETIFGTEFDNPVVEEVLTTDVLYEDYYEAPLGSVNYATLRVIIPVFSHAQPLFLTAIAVNRLTAVCFPLKNAAIWSARRVALAVVALALAAASLGAGTSVVTTVQQWVLCAMATAKERKDLVCGTRGVYYMEAISKALFILVSAVCCVMCFVLNITSITMISLLRTKGTLRQKAPEFRLFVHSLFMFVLQMLVACQDTVRYLDTLEDVLGDFDIDAYGWELPHSTEWLAGVKGTRKPIPEGVVFTPGCEVFDYPQRDLPLCSTWYRVLFGGFRLRQYPNIFTVRSLFQTLLSVSGSAFLLVISGHVRKAYFSFYFGRLRRKQKQFSSISVVQAAPARRTIVSTGRATL